METGMFMSFLCQFPFTKWRWEHFCTWLKSINRLRGEETWELAELLFFSPLLSWCHWLGSFQQNIWNHSHMKRNFMKKLQLTAAPKRQQNQSGCYLVYIFYTINVCFLFLDFYIYNSTNTWLGNITRFYLIYHIYQKTVQTEANGEIRLC